MDEVGQQSSVEDSTTGRKFRRLGYVVGGVAIIAMSWVLTVFILSALQDSQVAGRSSAQNSQKTQGYPEGTSSRTISANSYRDFGAVCGGFTVTNAASFTGKKTAIIVTFSQSPRTTDSWSYEDIGFGRSYTKTDGDFKKINTVACLHEIRDTKVFSKLCSYKEDDRTVTIKYYSIRYKLSYYEAKTGQRIADAGIVEAPAGECPSFVAYDQQTLSAYATPDGTTIDIAHSNFITQ